MADPSIDRALSVARQYSDAQQPEVRPYQFPWYQSVPHAITDYWYGDNANAQQGSWINKLFGTENPINIPGQAQEAGRTLGQGVKSGDLPMTLGGLASAGLMFLPGPRRMPMPALAKDEAAAAAASRFRTYHGSPHNWSAERLVEWPDGRTEYLVGAPDKLPDVPEGAKTIKDFPYGRPRLDKIGSGEGNAAFGRGFYTAENPTVGESYRHNLSLKNSEMAAAWEAQTAMKEANGDVSKAIEIINGRASETPINDGFWDEAIDLLKNPKGRMYEVNVNADPSHYLDWDQPIYKQSPHVLEALKSIGVKTEPKAVYTVQKSSRGDKWTVRHPWGEARGTFKSEEAAKEKAARLTDQWHKGSVMNEYTKLGGNTIYSALDNGEVSSKLKDAGIPGIKYLDQSSRTLGDGSRNYVHFRDDILEVIRKYGIAAALGLGAASGSIDQPTAAANPLQRD